MVSNSNCWFARVSIIMYIYIYIVISIVASIIISKKIYIYIFIFPAFAIVSFFCTPTRRQDSLLERALRISWPGTTAPCSRATSVRNARCWVWMHTLRETQLNIGPVARLGTSRTRCLPSGPSTVPWSPLAPTSACGLSHNLAGSCWRTQWCPAPYRLRSCRTSSPRHHRAHLSPWWQFSHCHHSSLLLTAHACPSMV